MSPVAMSVALAVGFALFGWGARRRLRSLFVGFPPRAAAGFAVDRLGARLRVLVDLAVVQRKLRREPWPGLAHLGISAGFLVLLLRTLTLWGRAFDPAFCLWWLGPEPRFGWLPLGALYGWVKDVTLVVVLAGVAVYAHLRLWRRPSRLALNAEGLLILGLIATMMVADALYDGAVLALAASLRHGAIGGEYLAPWPDRWVVHLGAQPLPPVPRWFPDPVGSTFGAALAGLSADALRRLAELGYFAHSLLVLAFLALLPHGKHFHVLTAVPNVFFAELGPPGRVAPLAPTTEAFEALLDEVARLPDPHAAPLGLGRIEHLSPKSRLDLYACTECGRCTARCPATLTGKPLRPKDFVVGLRNHLRERTAVGASATAPVDLVPAVVSPAVLWACTTCRACEEECPVAIRIVDKIVGLRRHILTVRGEHTPPELARPLTALELSGNPYGRPLGERLAWAAGLGVPTFAERPSAELLFWVGCAATFDPRARRVARATAGLLRAAGVDYAVLGVEESCTGDFARRAGHEALFLAQAEKNLATLARYRAAGGVRRIVTGCPHCLHVLGSEYPDHGGHYPVAHTTELFAELLAAGKLNPTRPIDDGARRPAPRGDGAGFPPVSAVVHDACYLARSGVSAADPRRLLRRLPGVKAVEVPDGFGARALCCGAGGAGGWLDEPGPERIGHRRARELHATGAALVVSSCPFCLTMLGDGLPAVATGEPPRLRDVAELLAEACGLADAVRMP